MILRAVPKRLPIHTGLAGARISCGVTSTSSQPPKDFSRTSQNGGTLVEVVLATFILALMATAVIGSINYGMMMMRLARENARATQILVEKTEALRLYKWEQVIGGFLPANFTAPYDPQAGTNNQGVTYTGQMSVSNVPFSTSYSTNVRQCTITLQWDTAGKIHHNREVTTYVTRDGLQNYVY